ncbi:uncharacterized protein [Globicephala melas]|uniref:uncharacterized protein n=1 Tax=Globicephala melas TaxID=9731 RepID=UPI00293D6DC3|nr:uncharacterized protein LOC115857589 [Globicephala melas]
MVLKSGHDSGLQQLSPQQAINSSFEGMTQCTSVYHAMISPSDTSRRGRVEMRSSCFAFHRHPDPVQTQNSQQPVLWACRAAQSQSSPASPEAQALGRRAAAFWEVALSAPRPGPPHHSRPVPTGPPRSLEDRGYSPRQQLPATTFWVLRLLPRNIRSLATSSENQRVEDCHQHHEAYGYFLLIQTRWQNNDQHGRGNNAVYYSYLDTIINPYPMRLLTEEWLPQSEDLLADQNLSKLLLEALACFPESRISTHPIVHGPAWEQCPGWSPRPGAMLRRLLLLCSITHCSGADPANHTAERVHRVVSGTICHEAALCLALGWVWSGTQGA